MSNNTTLLLSRRDNSTLFAFAMVMYAIAGGFFLLLVGQEALRGENVFQFFADSNTYLSTYAGTAENFDGRIVAIDSNYLGPLTLLRLLGGNIYLVMLANIYMFTHSVIHICNLLKLNPLKVGFLLMLSPITCSSLLSVNKEIFIFPFFALAMNAYVRRSLASLVLAMFVSILVRWQLLGFYFMIIGILHVRLFKSRSAVVLSLLLGISGFYLAIGEFITPILAYVENSIDTYDAGGSGLFEMVLGLQNKGLYFLVFPLKAFHLLFGMGLKVDRVFSPIEIYNDLFVGGHCLVAFIAFCFLCKRRKLTMRSDLIYISLLFLAVFAITPVFAPRYLYPVFVLWVIVLAGAPESMARHKKTPSLFRFLNISASEPDAAFASDRKHSSI